MRDKRETAIALGVALLLGLAMLFGALSSSPLMAALVASQDNSSQDAGNQDAAQADQDPANQSQRDDFDGKFALEWKIIRENEKNVSLKEHQGELTITTERGSIWEDQENDKNAAGGRVKNIHVIKNPSDDEDADWQITTCLVNFQPNVNWQQAGLLVYEDDENYLKLVKETDSRMPQGAIGFDVEKDSVGVWKHIFLDPDVEKLWLRITRRGEEYFASVSYDGKEFVERDKQIWKGTPKQLGLIAKNGGNINAPSIEARFDFFEFEVLPKEDEDATTDRALATRDAKAGGGD